MRNQKPLTRRGILSELSSLYDPLGFLAPVVLTAKMILQELCKKQVGWDEAVDDDIAARWTEWLSELNELNKISLERCYFPEGFKRENIQLHHFADASQSGYGAVSYLRVTDGHRVHCAFIIGKARLAPQKSITIPRLELTAATVAVRLDEMIKDELQVPIHQTYFWTDSTTVLQYIRNETKRFKTFVANRLTTIHDSTSPFQWRYVNTELNPGDIASRGLRPADVRGVHHWHRVSEFLWNNESGWPVQPVNVPLINMNDLEVKKEVAVNATMKILPLDEFVTWFSTLNRLQRATAWLLRFKAFCCNHFLGKSYELNSSSDLSVSEH